jgi:hypothetical protein
LLQSPLQRLTPSELLEELVRLRGDDGQVLAVQDRVVADYR